VNIPLVEVGRRAIAVALSTDATANDPIKTTVVLRDSTPSR
jgi:hypothetical protein